MLFSSQTRETHSDTDFGLFYLWRCSKKIPVIPLMLKIAAVYTLISSLRGRG